MHTQALRQATARIAQDGALDSVVYCAGYYKALRATEFDLGEMRRHEQVNYTGALHMLDAVLPQRCQGRQWPSQFSSDVMYQRCRLGVAVHARDSRGLLMSKS